METVCDSVINLKDDADRLTKDEKFSNFQGSSNSDSTNFKIKRCKHGRIVIKDLSKKKPVQQSDIKEAVQPQQIDSERLNQSELLNHDKLSTESEIVTEITSISEKIDKTAHCSHFDHEPAPESLTEIRQLPKFTADRLQETKTASKMAVAKEKNSPRKRSGSPSGKDHCRLKDDSCPSLAKNSRKHSGKSSLWCSSPKTRDRSRSPKESRVRSRNHSSDRDRTRGFRRDHVPSRSDRHTDRSPRPRKRSPPRRKSRSRSSSNSSNASQNNRSGGSCARINHIRSSENHSNSKKNLKTESISIRQDISHATSPQKSNRVHATIDPDKRSSTNQFNKESKDKNDLIQRTHIVNPSHPSSQSKTCDEVPVHQSSDSLNPHEIPILDNSSPLSGSSMSTSSDNSMTNEIYDPEEPILPISPGDSPPISPMIKAAIKKPQKPPEIEKNDDDVPSSAVQLNHQEKYLQKLNRQERVVEEIKIALKPFYSRRAINKEQYKDVLRRAVPKICHSKDGEINPDKIRVLVSAYVKKIIYRK